MSSSSSRRRARSIEGKRVQEDVGGSRVPSKLRKMLLSPPRQLNKRVQEGIGGCGWVNPYNPFMLPGSNIGVWGNPLTPQSKPPLKMFEMVEGKPVGDSVINYTVGKTHRWQFPNDPDKILVFDPYNATPNYGCITCTCGPSCGAVDEKILKRSVDEKPFHFLPGKFLVPSRLWLFVEEMKAKSDDKTLVVSHITRELTEEAEFLKLFKPFGKVRSMKLSTVGLDDTIVDTPVGIDGTIHMGFGFVTFFNKEDAQKAINTLNGSGPYGWDKCFLALDWASNIRKT